MVSPKTSMRMPKAIQIFPLLSYRLLKKTSGFQNQTSISYGSSSFERKLWVLDISELRQLFSQKRTCGSYCFLQYRQYFWFFNLSFSLRRCSISRLTWSIWVFFLSRYFLELFLFLSFRCVSGGVVCWVWLGLSSSSRKCDLERSECREIWFYVNCEAYFSQSSGCSSSKLNQSLI